mmetsp:Transcript_8676/g.20921  ORF Transcript_8676/g.20921 Transcript_8676/m.20921 type:complete len:231 (-) Transcript_8676:691-1383(-)
MEASRSWTVRGRGASGASFFPSDMDEMNSCSGRHAACLQSSIRSLPLKPSVASAMRSRGRMAAGPVSSGVFSSSAGSMQAEPRAAASLERMTRRMLSLWAALGMPTSKERGRRRSTASSRSYGLFVAARTMTLASESVTIPSHSCMNSVLTLVTMSWSMLLRFPRRASTSSTKMMLGCSFQARVKAAVTSFVLSPNHLLCSELTRRLMKLAPDSFAIALASIVFPVPGGP